MAEHRTDQIEAGRLGTLVQRALEVGADDAGGCFGPERQVLRASLFQPVELLRDRVGLFADAVDQFELLDDRRPDLLIAELRRHVGSTLLRLPP